MFSIDQNCHSLWDVVPKLHALVARGYRVRHFVEDIDVAFTSMGASVGDAPLRLVRERFHRSGGADWGAAMFYSEFLGRLPVELREWETLTGMKTKVLARELGSTTDELYDEFSPSDNWQLVGSSYVGDRMHHRVIGDLGAAESADFLRQLMLRARTNTLESFPQSDCQDRARQWFDAEEARLERLIRTTSDAKLVDLYTQWLETYFGGVSLDLRRTSGLFSCAGGAGFDILELFVRDYSAMADLYNQALLDTGVALRPLRTSDGELPFFATLLHLSRLVRCGVFLDGGELRIGRMSFGLTAGKLPLDRMRSAGIVSLAGKAVLLAIQARVGSDGDALALPYRGSSYLPAVHRLEKLLARRNLLPQPIRPIVRVRFRLLDRIRTLDTVIRLPAHLREYFGREEIPARQLAENYAPIAQAAKDRLEKFKDTAFRDRWKVRAFPKERSEIDRLDRRRRELADDDPKAPEFRQIWKDIKLRKRQMLDGLLRQIAGDWQASRIDYWDSRGALLPWSVALGGEKFYNELVTNAEIYPERGRHAE